MLSLNTPMRGHIRPISRTASLLAPALSLFIFWYVQPWAVKAYNDLCASQGMLYPGEWSAKYCAVLLAVIAVPVLAARSNLLVGINLMLSLAMALGAACLLTTAGNTPFECFSVAGHYNDRTSGLEDFDFWYFLLVPASYCLLLIDLIVWGARKMIARFARSSPA